MTKELKQAKLDLKREMMDAMLEHVTHYRADIVLDFEIVDEEMDYDSKYVWLLRETGTDLGKVTDLLNPDSWTSLTVPRSSWAYIIEDLKLTEVSMQDIKDMMIVDEPADDAIVSHVVEDWTGRELFSCKDLDEAEEFINQLVDKEPEADQEGARDDLYIYAVTAAGDKVAPEW